MRTRVIAFIVLGAVVSLFAYAGTGGTPLGGLGTGYIVYNAVTGTFKMGTHPAVFYTETNLGGGFHFYTNVNGTVQTKLNASTSTEDAKIPTYTADYGSMQNVHFTLLGFGPINPGDEKLASLPLAFFEFTVTNNNTTSADAAIALGIAAFVGGTAAKVTNGINWPGAQNTTLLTSVDSGTATITTGSSTSEFTGNGVMNNGAGSILAAKVTIPAGKSARIRFVYAWYRSFGNENFYYYNYYTNSQDIATYGQQNFTTIRNNAQNMVTKTMASNLPGWFNDRLLNNLYPLIHNVQMTKDGRTAVREGCFPIIGTIDQQGHAQIPLSYWFPNINWRQMRFWAHTQFRGGVDDGAIHHDFNGPSGIDTMCTWEAYGHTDYRTGIDQWADLNMHFIIGTYELFLASGNKDSLTALWPYLKKTGARSLVQCGTTNYVPVGCLSSYDRAGATDQYNGSLALVGYQAMLDMATVMGDTAEITKWTNQVPKAKAQYLQLYWNSTYGTDEAHCAGYAFAHSLGLPAIVPDSVARITFSRMFKQYANGMSTGLWHAYTCAHFADLGIAIGSADSGMVNHLADWNGYYNGHAAYVFWQNLDYNVYTNCSYMTMPFVWRSLFLIEGYGIDMYRKILRIRPSLPSTVNKHLTGGVITTSTAWGTLDYAESATDPVQNMAITYDKPVSFATLILKNNSGTTTPTVIVTKGGTPVALTAVTEGTGLDANIRVTFTSDLAIDNAGINVKVYKNPVKTVVPAREGGLKTGIGPLLKGSSFVFSLENAGLVRLDLFDLAGRQVATLASGSMTSGRHTAFMPAKWSGAGVLRLSTNGKSIEQCVVVPR